MKIKNEAQQIMITYCKNWYRTTGNIFKDFKIILDEYYSTDSWDITDICEILLSNFDEIVKDNLTKIFNATIFDRYEEDIDIKKKFLKSLKSVICYSEINCFEGFDKSYKDKFNLKRDDLI